VLSMLPTLSARRAARGSIFRQAVISVTVSMLVSAVAGHVIGPPSTATTPHRPAVTFASGRDSVPTQLRIDHCQSTGPQVWLTFDDGGSPQQVGRILAVLRQQHVQAIFFPIGSWAAANPGLVQRMASDGQLIGDHTHDHIDLAKASDAKAVWQIRHGMTHTSGTVPLLRPPFGAGAYTARLDSIAAFLGMKLCTWTVDTRDWTGASAATIIHRVRHGDALTPPARAGGVVIMHMNGEHTGQALPGVIRAVRARGLQLHALPR
jgi:peptidoglycan-N-acetylglucosamine deacetylase